MGKNSIQRFSTQCNALLHPFLYVIDSKRALSFGEAQPFRMSTLNSDSFLYNCPESSNATRHSNLRMI